MVGEPTQIQPGEHHPSHLAVAAAESQGKMDHALSAGGIGPIVADSETFLTHRALKEGLIGDRSLGDRVTRAEYPAGGVGRREDIVIRVLSLQCDKMFAAGVRFLQADRS